MAWRLKAKGKGWLAARDWSRQAHTERLGLVPAAQVGSAKVQRTARVESELARTACTFSSLYARDARTRVHDL
ncbi:hypothetical protein E5676_scaffold436G00860 [Cucumis melo var. makuwa]|uniref:Uncharacterized protein n=1 Tax=Cucumis melo var. makuwa TaxID=1194695 RepID=A0A5D3DRF1_CUCMM|nr:hypothetical protein E5676_scaffold436G00860 [Cucumis melo var. makuwa]